MSAEPEQQLAEPAADQGVPQPPWLKPPRTTRARAPLSRDTIVDAALRLLAREGASGLSMRHLADELGSGAGAIYWHVANKEQLIQLMFDRVLADLPLPDVDPARWQEQIKQAARDARDVMIRHPGLAELSFGRIPLGPNAVRYLEWHLSVLRAGGLPDRVVALATDLIHLFVDSFSYEECVGLAPPTGADSSVADFIGELRAYFASLPPSGFPNITELADDLTSGGKDVRFEFGLDILVGGLAAHANKE